MQTWWMLMARGGLGILLGLVVLLSPRVGVGELVVLFGSYALLDGIWALCWAVRASRRPLEGSRGEWSPGCSKSSRRCVFLGA